MQSEIDSLRQQIAILQTELALKEWIQEMQSEINTLKVQIIEITGNDKDYISDNINQQLSLVYPDYIQFIINYISLWSENRINKVNSANLYQAYCTWCDINNKKLLNNTVIGKIKTLQFCTVLWFRVLCRSVNLPAASDGKIDRVLHRSLEKCSSAQNFN